MSIAIGLCAGIEEELRGRLVEGLPDLLARDDLIVETDNALILQDFKTSRTSWDENKVANSADQLLLYSDLVRTLASEKPLRLEFAVFAKTKSPSVTIHPGVYDSRQVERTKRIVERVWGAIANEHFYPNPSHHCATCSFRKPCRDWQG
ncbi:MAG: PD-(D/E)XK nuclease family protein [Planctomycetes bacterium]|nr:PD-(D/E)XK nuclease family protein [Planctomycetota bacterium]